VARWGFGCDPATLPPRRAGQSLLDEKFILSSDEVVCIDVTS